MLVVDNICAKYDRYQALYDVSFKLKEKDIIGIYGPNGHGKSTLLKTICGILKPSSGTIRLNGIEIERKEIKEIVELGLVYIPENRNLFPEMNVIENLYLGAFNKSARKGIKKNLELVFYLFPRLKERQKQIVSTMSGGEARMLTIGRGLMSNAEILAIDEPSIGLSPILRKDVFNKIAEINQKGKSVILVEQNVNEARGLASIALLLEDGKIILQGEEKEVFNDMHFKSIMLGL